MNVNLYLPDELGQQAKEADLPLSRLLREAVIDELERRRTVAQTLSAPQTFEFAVQDGEGSFFTGRLTGKEIAHDDRRRTNVYVTDDERVIVVVEDGQYSESSDPAEELRGVLSDADYKTAMTALGLKPIIDL